MYICIIYVYKFRLIACLRGTFLLKAASVGQFIQCYYNVSTRTSIVKNNNSVCLKLL